jgi:hypothetical protein
VQWTRRESTEATGASRAMDATRCEVGKDLVKLLVYEIEKQLLL